MEIHLARNGSALGVFPDSEVREGLASGRFQPSDLAWRQGMSTWTPLAGWPEFSGVAPADLLAAAPVPASEIPWEQSRSFGSLLRTLWMVVASPRKLATGRFEEGSSFGLAYAAIGLGFLPILAAAALSSAAQEGQREALAELLEGFEGPFFDGFRSSLQEGAGDGVAFGIPVAACSALLSPLIYALIGILEWSALRLTGSKLAFARTVMASMSLHTLVTVAFLPLVLLSGALALALPLAGLGTDVAFALASLALLALALGRALTLNPWRIVLAWLILFLLLACCICGCAGFIGALGAATSS
jgi:hypothetical protein